MNLRDVGAKLLQPVDQSIAELHRAWDRWTPEERAEFRQWIAQAAELKRKVPLSFLNNIHMTISLTQFVHNEAEIEIVAPLEAMTRAIECWDRGELYATQPTLHELTR